MIEQFVNFVIRPPRAEYNPDQYIWEKDFTLGGRKYIREDLELMNERGHSLRCSHYVPSQVPPFPVLSTAMETVGVERMEMRQMWFFCLRILLYSLLIFQGLAYLMGIM